MRIAPDMEWLALNKDAQKIAIWPPWMAEHAKNCQEQFLPGLLDCRIPSADGLYLALAIPYPHFSRLLIFL